MFKTSGKSVVDPERFWWRKIKNNGKCEKTILSVKISLYICSTNNK